MNGLTDRIGPGRRCLLIAEAGVNHDGDPDRAHRLIDAARAAGADAVKFQAFVSGEVATGRAAKAAYQARETGDGDQRAMLRALELAPEVHAGLKSHCDSVGVAYLCTPCDPPSLAMLDRLGVEVLKIGSADCDNLPFLRRIAATRRPAILSTGMATLGEVEAGLAALAGAPWLALLQCTTEYPARPEEANLRALETLRRAFGRPVGLSDHTEGVGVAPLAVALGARLIEKHFTLDRAMPGPDHKASLDPAGFADLARAVRTAEAALGDGVKRPMPSEAENRRLVRKSVVVRRDLPAGHRLAAGDLACKRPADGLPPPWTDRLIGRRTVRALAADARIGLNDIDWGD